MTQPQVALFCKSEPGSWWSVPGHLDIISVSSMLVYEDATRSGVTTVGKRFPGTMISDGAAAKAFEAFLTKWSQTKDYFEKMILIDTLLHEFHLSLISGTVHRPVAINFMDGTREKVERVIQDLSSY